MLVSLRSAQGGHAARVHRVLLGTLAGWKDAIGANGQIALEGAVFTPCLPSELTHDASGEL